MSELDWGALQQEAKAAAAMPEGEYALIITDSTATTTSNGKPMIKVKCRVFEGPHAKKIVWNNFTISAESPVALKIFFQQMAVLGLDANFFALSPSMADVAANLMNRGFIGVIGIRQWQGADQNEIKGFKPLPAGTVPPPGLVTGPPVVGASPMSQPAQSATPTPTTPNGGTATPITPTSTPITPTTPSTAPPRAF